MLLSSQLTEHGLGHCGRTARRVGNGSCTTNDHRSYRLFARGWDAGMEECSRRCEDCERCNYISYSLHFQDCSIYHACQMDALHSSPQNRTTGVPAFRSLMVRAVAPEQESLQDEATAKNAARAEAKARAEKAFAATSARAWSSTLRSAGVPESSWGARCRSLGADPLKLRRIPRLLLPITHASCCPTLSASADTSHGNETLAQQQLCTHSAMGRSCGTYPPPCEPGAPRVSPLATTKSLLQVVHVPKTAGTSFANDLAARLRVFIGAQEPGRDEICLGASDPSRFRLMLFREPRAHVLSMFVHCAASRFRLTNFAKRYLSTGENILYTGFHEWLDLLPHAQ